MSYTTHEVQKALNLPDFDSWTAQKKMMPSPRTNHRPPDKPGQVRLGVVLVLLYRRGNDLYLVLTRRRDDLHTHAGQISFPGGRNKAPETLLATALREAQEEIGIDTEELEVLGKLSPLYISLSDFEVQPFVAWYKNAERPNFTPNISEVAEIIEVSLRHLCDPAMRAKEARNIHGCRVLVPYFAVQGQKVWGATAMILSEFLERLKIV